MVKSPYGEERFLLTGFIEGELVVLAYTERGDSVTDHFDAKGR